MSKRIFLEKKGQELTQDLPVKRRNRPFFSGVYGPQ